jgi:hypothetical protein
MGVMTVEDVRKVLRRPARRVYTARRASALSNIRRSPAGSPSVPLAELPDRLGEFPGPSGVVYCHSGNRHAAPPFGGTGYPMCAACSEARRLAGGGGFRPSPRGLATVSGLTHEDVLLLARPGDGPPGLLHRWPRSRESGDAYALPQLAGFESSTASAVSPAPEDQPQPPGTVVFEVRHGSGPGFRGQAPGRGWGGPAAFSGIRLLPDGPEALELAMQFEAQAQDYICAAPWAATRGGRDLPQTGRRGEGPPAHAGRPLGSSGHGRDAGVKPLQLPLSTTE